MAPVLLASSALVLVLSIALVREVRLRRALQALLRQLLRHWRQNARTDKSSSALALRWSQLAWSAATQTNVWSSRPRRRATGRRSRTGDRPPKP